MTRSFVRFAIIIAIILGQSTNAPAWHRTSFRQQIHAALEALAKPPSSTNLRSDESKLVQDATSAVLAGRVTADRGGGPLEGVRLLLESPALLSPREVATDADGRFRVSLLPGGQYSITYTMDGYISHRRTMRLVAGQVANANAKLKAAGGQEGTIENSSQLSLRSHDKTETVVQTVYSSDFLESVFGFGRSAVEPAAPKTPVARQAALTKSPIMGVSLKGASESDILEMAQTLIKTGLKDKGYAYMVLNDWQSSGRSIDNRLRFDSGLFSDGTALIQKLKNDCGIKVGLNTSISDLTNGGKPGSMHFEALDARTFAEWGAGYVRVDYSHVTDVRKDKNGMGEGTWPTSTPDLNYVGYNKLNGATALETRLHWKAFSFKGGARIFGNRLTGLSSNGGEATFTIKVAAVDAGKYMIAFGYNKQRNGNASRERLIQAVVSNKAAGVHNDAYNFEFPRSSMWHNESRATGVIDLKAGTNSITLRNPVMGRESDAAVRYKAMAASFQRHCPSTLFAINDWGRAGSIQWANDADTFAYSARVAADPTDMASVKAAYKSAISSQNSRVITDLGPINSFLTRENVKTQLSIWSILPSPIVLNATAEKLSEYANIFGNEYMIGILNDSLRLQGKLVSSLNDVDVVAKPISGNRVALLIYNKSAAPAVTLINIDDIRGQDSRVELPKARQYEVMDVWSGRTETVEKAFPVPLVPADGAALYIVKPSMARSRYSSST
jgi:hypothetical protein